MSFDFLVHFALNEDDDNVIDQIVSSRGRYTPLQHADLTTRAQVLTTGLIHTDDRFPLRRPERNDASLKDFIKNGRQEKRKGNRVEIKGIGGYPELVRNKDIGLPLHWKGMFQPDPEKLAILPSGSCLISLDLQLLRPFHSKDDRCFYPCDAPLKRDWILHTPYLAASGIKGLLRWAWRMCWDDNKLESEACLFGPRTDNLKEDTAWQGCLMTWPLFWEGKIGEEVINPQNRQTGKGMDPVKFEVVKAGARSRLSLLLVNRNSEPNFPGNILSPFLDALFFLLSSSGISAKRTSDWGSVKVTQCCACLYGEQFQNLAVEEVEDTDRGTDDAIKEEAAKNALWEEVTDEDGNLYAESDGEHITAKILVKLTGSSKTQVRKNRHKVYERLQGLWKERQAPGAQVQEGTSAQDESAAKPSYLQIKDTGFKRWKEKLERLLANVSDGGTAS